MCEVIAMTARLTPHGHQWRTPAESSRLGLRALIGSGDRIGALVLPVTVVGVALNLTFPDAFSVGGPPRWLQVVSVAMLSVGVLIWAWSVTLILTKVRDGELVTSGPYAIVKHPLYTSVGLLVLPWGDSCSTPGWGWCSAWCYTPDPGCLLRVRRPGWPIGSARSGTRIVRT